MLFGARLESESINDIVFDITGADVDSYSKEFSRPETCERSVSAMTGVLMEVNECKLNISYFIFSYTVFVGLENIVYLLSFIL